MPCIQVIVLNSSVNADSSVEPTLVQQPAPPTTGRSRSGAPKKPTGRKRKVPTAKHIAADKAYETAQAAYLAEQDAKRVYVEPLRVIEQDDGSPERLSKLDLPGLQNRYGSRLRIRVDAEERYHALTGAYNHVSRWKWPQLMADLINVRPCASLSASHRSLEDYWRYWSRPCSLTWGGR